MGIIKPSLPTLPTFLIYLTFLPYLPYLPYLHYLPYLPFQICLKHRTQVSLMSASAVNRSILFSLTSCLDLTTRWYGMFQLILPLFRDNDDCPGYNNVCNAFHDNCHWCNNTDTEIGQCNPGRNTTTCLHNTDTWLLTTQSIQSTRLSFQSSELGFPIPSPARECCSSPLWVQGGRHTRFVGGGGGTQFRQRERHSGTLCIKQFLYGIYQHKNPRETPWFVHIISWATTTRQANSKTFWQAIK